MLTFYGVPVTQEMFNQFAEDLNPHFVAYTGKAVTKQEVIGWFSAPVSVWQLQKRLAHAPAFWTGPMWKLMSPRYYEWAKPFYVSRDEVRWAILLQTSEEDWRLEMQIRAVERGKEWRRG